MKTLAATLILLSAVLSMAGPSSGSFTPAATRQDLTGQGTFHRQGLIRQQERAVASGQAARTSPPSSKKKSTCFFADLWNSLFPKKSKPPTP